MSYRLNKWSSRCHIIKRKLLYRYLFVVTVITVVCCTILRHQMRMTQGSRYDSDVGSCTYRTCPQISEVDDDVFYVHLIPYSHLDVGWLETADLYYTGHPQTLGCVRCILKSVISELFQDPRRRFSFVEMKYFSRYWAEADQEERGQIQQLIKERRLELLGGGWVMSDAAVTVYNDIIDQHTMGLQFINDTFGHCALPRCVWHVDQFGHSREHASLLAQMGFDALFITRIPIKDKLERQLSNNMEFVWLTSPQNLRNRSSIFTHITYNGYSPPLSYVLDIDEYRIVTSKSTKPFLKHILKQFRSYSSNHIMVSMGSDFGYRKSENWFQVMDHLIDQINSMEPFQGSRIKLLYSTPSCYAHYANRKPRDLEVKTNDFLPYSSADEMYWTGFYTSRPGIKRYVKYAGQILQSCKQMMLFAELYDMHQQVDVLRDAVSVMQHHDAITGTHRKNVSVSYSRILSNGIAACQSVMSRAYSKLWWMTNDHENLTVYTQFCPDLNISSCPVSEFYYKFYVSLYNPLGWTVSTSLRFPITSCTVDVSEGFLDLLPVQIVPVAEHIKRIQERSTHAEREAVLRVSIPPVSYKTFFVKQMRCQTKKKSSSSVSSRTRQKKKIIVIQNEYIALYFNGSTGRLIMINNKEIQLTEPLSQGFSTYDSYLGGAYSFLAKSRGPNVVNPSGLVDLKVIKGDIVEEVHQTFSAEVSQVVRLYRGNKFAEFQWIVGPINHSDGNGKNVISKFSSRLDSGRSFYTDSNGRETIERRRQLRKSLSGRDQDIVSSNYYPVTTRIYLQDRRRNLQLTVLPDRAQGGTSLSSGNLELMVHRRTLFDDGYGLNEPLDEVSRNGEGVIYTGKHYVCLDTIERSAEIVRSLAIQKHLEPSVMFTPVEPGTRLDLAMTLRLGETLNNRGPSQYWNSVFMNPDFNFTFQSFLFHPLPDNIHLLTLEYISGMSDCRVVLRLEHIYEVDEHPTFSDSVILSLQDLFITYDIIEITETSLGVYMKQKVEKKFGWETLERRIQHSKDFKTLDQTKVLLRPMEIKTFTLKLVPRDWTSVRDSTLGNMET